MPLARLSIKSALHIAKSNVTVAPSPSGPWWVVRVDHNDSKSVYTGEWTKPAAQAKKRERRIFLALRLLGFEDAAADRLAVAANADQRDWRRLVAVYVERRELSGS